MKSDIFLKSRLITPMFNYQFMSHSSMVKATATGYIFCKYYLINNQCTCHSLWEILKFRLFANFIYNF